MIKPFEIPAAWDAVTLHRDPSWMIHLTDPHRVELRSALEFFKDTTHSQGLTAQWLHGNMTPQPASFPLPTLGPLLKQVQTDLEEKYGLVVLKGMPVSDFSGKELHLLHAGIASYVGTPRPQTVFGEVVQDIKDIGQASLIERRGSKHNRALPFHNDPCDAISFLCIKPALSGGKGLFASSVAIHNALLNSSPTHVQTLYQDFTNTYQDYLFVRTGMNQDLLPKQRVYAMPTFSTEQGYFACKYSRFYIDQAQEIAEVPRLTSRQRQALDAFEGELHNEKWHLTFEYQPGDVVFVNNFVCFHARTAFTDDPANETCRRHLSRIWLSMPNSRPLSPRYKHYFFQNTEAGAIRGGLPLPEVCY